MTTTKLFANKIVGTETTVKSGVSGERLRSNKFNFLFFSLIAAVALSVSFASCSKDDDDNETALTATTEPGVVINGVKWATRNVDSVGYFADSPESFGRYYQWNRKKAWTAGSTDGMDNSDPTGTTWETENDPSPGKVYSWEKAGYVRLQSS
jgi:hypothetical protein